MSDSLPSLSTDQVAAFVEVARAGSLRAATVRPGRARYEAGTDLDYLHLFSLDWG